MSRLAAEGLPWVVAFVAAGLVLLALSCGLSSRGDVSVPCAPPTPGNDACVLPVVARSVAAGVGPWKAVADGAAKTCGIDSATVRTIWAAHVQAEVTEGFVPKMIPVGGDP